MGLNGTEGRPGREKDSCGFHVRCHTSVTASSAVTGHGHAGGSEGQQPRTCLHCGACCILLLWSCLFLAAFLEHHRFVHAAPVSISCVLGSLHSWTFSSSEWPPGGPARVRCLIRSLGEHFSLTLNTLWSLSIQIRDAQYN